MDWIWSKGKKHRAIFMSDYDVGFNYVITHLNEVHILVFGHELLFAIST